MNLIDSYFLCLDIGTSAVHGIAHHIRGARISRSATCTIENYDTVFALRSVISELDKQLGAHFDSAYITGNFGPSEYKMTPHTTTWAGEHKITPADVRAHISEIERPDGMFPMHIVPLRYSAPTNRDMDGPVGHIDRQLVSVFGSIYYQSDKLNKIVDELRRVHIQPIAFFDPHFAMNATMRPTDKTAIFMDMGAEFTTVSVWTPRGPVFHTKIPLGGTHITNEISTKLNIDFVSAERVKRASACMRPTEMDHFTPADSAFSFSRADVNDIVLPIIVDIMVRAKTALASTIERRRPTCIILTGGGAEIPDMDKFVENTFTIPVQKYNSDAGVRALYKCVWDGMHDRRDAYIARRQMVQNQLNRIKKLFHHKKRKPKNRFIPIMPSTLTFDMNNPSTYSMFNAGGISMIHVDIMDGFYVPNVRGSISELQQIRGMTRDHLHVHLMTQNPAIWAADAISAGADTIIVSTGTMGVRTALQNIRASGRRCGVALHPDSSPKLLEKVLRDIDEVMVMSVVPGASGQEFDMGALNKIKALDFTRKKHNLNYKISVDGGINADTAKLCWAAGADFLVSGSYLSNATDFPLAVQTLLPER